MFKKYFKYINSKNLLQKLSLEIYYIIIKIFFHNLQDFNSFFKKIYLVITYFFGLNIIYIRLLLGLLNYSNITSGNYIFQIKYFTFSKTKSKIKLEIYR